MECACFPRECTYSNETKACSMHAPGEERATKNPWGDKLPMAGTKCAPRSRATWHGKAPSQDECDLQQCTHEDYTHTISGQTSLWGTVGLKGKGIYNCLTMSQSPAGMLAIAPAFPDGRPNTIAERNKIFEEVIARGGQDSEPVAVMNWGIINYTGCEDCHEAEFCVYAGNPGCGGIGAADAVTFDNRRNAKGCPIRPVLTIPLSYIRDLADLQAKGASLAKEMLHIMLQQGFSEYRGRGHSGPVRQCIHLPSGVTVHWLHLHSFCVGPSFDGMPGNDSLCSVMESAGDADQIAGDWSTAPLVHRRSDGL
ncbi:unnamed protein product [Prorocentrum cordatum]|uniref:Uncharacterized protein n=1 Tax=Prorocentrum cordatum TaxID=2364126 RepID=A0ABN9V9G7_9DINO|nr:unnamed protein product [Polarella glacialis]